MLNQPFFITYFFQSTFIILSVFFAKFHVPFRKIPTILHLVG